MKHASYTLLLRAGSLWLVAGLIFSARAQEKQKVEPAAEKPAQRTVRGVMQTRPGGPLQKAEVAVHPVPTDLPLVPAAEAQLDDAELVLGVVLDGQAVAYPVRYLAMFEVVDARVGKTPVAPTW